MEERVSRSLERPGKSSSINQFSSQYQFNKEIDPVAFQKFENEQSTSKMPLNLNLEDFLKEETLLTDIFTKLKDQEDPSVI